MSGEKKREVKLKGRVVGHVETFLSPAFGIRWHAYWGNLRIGSAPTAGKAEKLVRDQAKQHLSQEEG